MFKVRKASRQKFFKVPRCSKLGKPGGKKKLAALANAIAIPRTSIFRTWRYFSVSPRSSAGALAPPDFGFALPGLLGRRPDVTVQSLEISVSKKIDLWSVRTQAIFSRRNSSEKKTKSKGRHGSTSRLTRQPSDVFAVAARRQRRSRFDHLSFVSPRTASGHSLSVCPSRSVLCLSLVRSIK